MKTTVIINAIIIVCGAVMMWVAFASILDYIHNKKNEREQREWERRWQAKQNAIRFEIPEWDATPGKLEAEAAEELGGNPSVSANADSSLYTREPKI